MKSYTMIFMSFVSFKIHINVTVFFLYQRLHQPLLLRLHKINSQLADLKKKLINSHPVAKKVLTHVEMWGLCGPR